MSLFGALVRTAVNVVTATESPFVEPSMPWYERLALRFPYFRKRWLTFGVLLVAGWASMGASCGKPKPPGPPEPTPPPCAANEHLVDGVCVPIPDPTTSKPLTPIGLDLLLRSEAGKLTRDGKPHAMRLAIPCWSDIENRLFVDDGTPGGREIPYLWPLVSPEWMKYAGGLGWNAGEVRPYFKDACCGLESIGGPYAADGSWNSAFWAQYHKVQWAATALKWNLIVDVADGWIAKHCKWGEEKLCPFLSAEDNRNFFAVPLNPSLKAWVAKLVSETENYAGVIWQISNESEQARFDDGSPSWSKEWERAMYAEIRANEKNVVHMIFTNTRDYEGPYDGFTAHTLQMLTGPVAGRPIIVNEYNPHLDPARFKAFYCAAVDAGQTFGYWRSDGKLADQTGSLNVDCAAPPTCPDPLPDRSKFTFSIKCAASGVCDATPIVEKDCAYCASIGMGEYNGQPRCACPIRNECPGTPGFEGMCQDRVVCEQYVMSTPEKSILAPLWVIDAGELVLVDEFGFRAKCNGCSWMKACNADQSVCKLAPMD